MHLLIDQSARFRCRIFCFGLLTRPLLLVPSLHFVVEPTPPYAKVRKTSQHHLICCSQPLCIPPCLAGNRSRVCCPKPSACLLLSKLSAGRTIRKFRRDTFLELPGRALAAGESGGCSRCPVRSWRVAPSGGRAVSRSRRWWKWGAHSKAGGLRHEVWRAF